MASAAGVSVETVNTFGGKAAVFLSSFELAFMGATEGAAMLEMDAMAPASAADTLEGFVDVMTDLVVAGNQRTAGLWAAYVEAANTDADLAAAYAARMQEMRVDGRRVLEAIVDRGLCPAPADPQDTVDRVWVVVHPSQYLLLVDHAGWDVARYSAWMSAAVVQALRGARPDRAATPPTTPSPGGPPRDAQGAGAGTTPTSSQPAATASTSAPAP